MYGKSSRISVCFLACVFALAAVSVRAQTVAGDGISRALPTSSVGNTVAFEKFMGNVQSIGRPTIAVASDGTLLASNLSKLPNGVPLAVNSRISKAAVAGALARFVGKAAFPITIGLGVYDLVRELGYAVNRAPDGTQTLTASGSVSCLQFGGYGDCMPVSQADAQCSQIAGNDPHAVVYSSPGVPSYCWIGSPNSRFYPQFGTATGMQTKSTADLENDIAAKSGWPSNSALARATNEAVQAGEVVELEPWSFDGPVTSQGPVQTTTNADGSTVRNSTVNNYHYDGNKITITNTTSTTNISPTGVSTPGPVVQSSPDVQPDPVDPCKENPDRIGCSKFGTIEQMQLPKSTIDVAISPVQFSEVSGCPNDLAMNFTIMGRAYSPSFSYSKMCSTAHDSIRPVVLILAFAAAAFIFVGGLKT